MSAIGELQAQGVASSAGGSLLGALIIVARHRGIHLSETQLRRDHRIGPDGPSLEQLLRIARASGMRVHSTRLTFRDLMRAGPALPAVLLLKNGNAMVIIRAESQAQPPHVLVEDPAAGEDALLALDKQRLGLGWAGEVILLKRDYRVRDEDQPFGLGLIAAQLLRDHRLVRDIAVAAVMLSLLALAPIMFWRLLIDRVLYFHSLDTLAVLCAAMLVLIIFETIFGYMRRFLVLHITARVDAGLSTYMFDKVLNLPLDFFERSSTGMITRDMNEIFKIRGFLTGQIFGTVLDTFVLLIFLPIMFFFSAALTAVVLGFCGLICLWIVRMLPVLRRKGAAAFRAEGARNAFLVENLQGIRTVKSLALDARQRQEWDVRVATAARLRLDEARSANLIQTFVTPLERLMVSGVFALAVYLAVTSNDQYYVGALVAFMMLTQRVASPLVQLSHLLQQYDEVLINGPCLALPFRAEESRASGLHDAAHTTAAVAAGAWLTLAVVDRELVLEIAELAIGLNIVTQGRPTGDDRLAENRADAGDEPLYPPVADRPGEASWRDRRAEQRLAYVNIAEPGDDALVEQRRFDRGHLAGERRREVGGIEFRLERLRAQPRQQRVRRLSATLHIVEQAKPARIVKADDGSVVEGEHDVVMLGVGQGSAACGNPAGHPEVKKQQSIRIEFDQDVLSAPAEPTDLRAFEAGGERGGKRPS